MFVIKIKIYFLCLFSLTWPDLTWPFVSIKYMVWVMQWDRNCYNIPMLKFHHARHTLSSFLFKSPNSTLHAIIICSFWKHWLINIYISTNKKYMYARKYRSTKSLWFIVENWFAMQIWKTRYREKIYSILLRNQFENTLGSFKYQNMQSNFFSVWTKV